MPETSASSGSSVVDENDIPLPSKCPRKVGFLGAKKSILKKKKYEIVTHKMKTMKEQEDEKVLNTLRHRMSIIQDQNLQLEISQVKLKRRSLELAIFGVDMDMLSMNLDFIEDRVLREHFQKEKSRILQRRIEMEDERVGNTFEDVGASGNILMQQISIIREQNHQLEISLLKQRRQKYELALFESETKILSKDLNCTEDLALRELFRAEQARILQRREEMKHKIMGDAFGDVGASGGLT